MWSYSLHRCRPSILANQHAAPRSTSPSLWGGVSRHRAAFRRRIRRYRLRQRGCCRVYGTQLSILTPGRMNRRARGWSIGAKFADALARIAQIILEVIVDECSRVARVLGVDERPRIADPAVDAVGFSCIAGRASEQIRKCLSIGRELRPLHPRTVAGPQPREG